MLRRGSSLFLTDVSNSAARPKLLRHFADALPLTSAVCHRAGEALDEVYGAKACAALAKTARIGWLEASITRTRRVLRTIAAAILSNCTRLVAVQALANAVPASAWRRRLTISV